MKAHLHALPVLWERADIPLHLPADRGGRCWGKPCSFQSEAAHPPYPVVFAPHYSQAARLHPALLTAYSTPTSTYELPATLCSQPNHCDPHSALFQCSIGLIHQTKILDCLFMLGNFLLLTISFQPSLLGSQVLQAAISYTFGYLTSLSIHLA